VVACRPEIEALLRGCEVTVGKAGRQDVLFLSPAGTEITEAAP
jgi:hypothetical protein